MLCHSLLITRSTEKVHYLFCLSRCLTGGMIPPTMTPPSISQAFADRLCWRRRRSWEPNILMASLAAALLGAGIPAFAQPPRVLGIDVSTYQGNIGTANWATLKRATNQQVGGSLATAGTLFSSARAVAGRLEKITGKVVTLLGTIRFLTFPSGTTIPTSCRTSVGPPPPECSRGRTT